MQRKPIQSYGDRTKAYYEKKAQELIDEAFNAGYRILILPIGISGGLAVQPLVERLSDYVEPGQNLIKKR